MDSVIKTVLSWTSTHVGIPVLLLLVGWVGVSVSTMSTDIAVIKSQMSQVSVVMESSRQNSQDITEVRERLVALETRLVNLEADILELRRNLD